MKSMSTVRARLRQALFALRVTMLGLVLPEIIIGVTIFALFALVARNSRNRSSTLVLQKFSLTTAPLQSPTPTIEMVGRMKGLIAFALSLMGFSPITRFTVTGTDLRCESTSLSGQRSQFIPIRCVATVSAGVHKPVSSLVSTATITVFGVYVSFESSSFAPIAIALGIAIALVVSYFLTKKFFIEVHANGGTLLSLLFTPNVIEGVPIDVKQALAVAAVIRDMVLDNGTVGEVPAITDTPANADPPNLNSSSPVTANDDLANAEYENEDVAESLFAEARQFVQVGQRELAVSVLQDIVRRFPDSKVAQKAHRTLQKSGVREKA